MDSHTSEYRRRAEHESQLLLNRTGVILTFNGLVAVAVGWSPMSGITLTFLAAIIAINLLWILCGVQTNRWLKTLNDYELSDEKARGTESSEVERLRRYKKWAKWLRPTFVLAVLVPVVLEIAWVVNAVLLYVFSRGTNAMSPEAGILV
ncbi:MAG: hypothetical protein ACOC4Y_02185 [bacterium]